MGTEYPIGSPPQIVQALELVPQRFECLTIRVLLESLAMHLP